MSYAYIWLDETFARVSKYMKPLDLAFPFSYQRDPPFLIQFFNIAIVKKKSSQMVTSDRLPLHNPQWVIDCSPLPLILPALPA
jgi:hypothetical protein